MTNTSVVWTIDELAKATDIGADASRLALRLARLVARGQPVGIDQVQRILHELGIDNGRSDKLLNAYTERDRDGNVVGVFSGITLRQTPHRFTTDTAQLWAWCAGDTLVLPAVLNQTGRVESTSPVSDHVIRLTITPSGVTEVDPPDAVISIAGLVIDDDTRKVTGFVTDMSAVTSVQEILQAFCHRMFFFPSSEQAQQWAAGKDDIAILPVKEAFTFFRRIFTDAFLAHEQRHGRTIHDNVVGDAVPRKERTMTDANTDRHPSTEVNMGADDFSAAWQEVFERQRDMNDVIQAAIRLTEGGARTVGIDRLAAAVDRPVDEARRLVDRADAGLPSLRTGHTEDQVWLDLAASEAPRFWYEIGDRRIGVAGCGADIFWVTQALDRPMRAEATCSVTGTTITVDFSPDGVTAVQPADAVVAAIHPGTVPEAAQLTDRRRVDADVCVQQTFFANAEAAQSWLERNPAGRVMPVREFDQWLRHIINAAAASAPTAPNTGASTAMGGSGRCATIVCGHA